MDLVSFQEAQTINHRLDIPELSLVDRDIYAAYGEILGSDIICHRPLPAFDNSAMDGYALKSTDLGKKLKVTSRILAGEDTRTQEVLSGSCVKIMTGGMVPKGADVVAPFEVVEVVDKDMMIAPHDLQIGANIRFKGEEQAIGSVLAKRGEKLTHGLIALIASQGISKLPILRKLKIGVYSTGNEIIEPDQKAKEHQIYNINAVGIISLLQAYGHQAQYLGILKDSSEALMGAIGDFESHDVVITSGGASTGEADILEQSLRRCEAKILYHGINLKPGRPIMLATLGKCTIFALPGNPLSGLLNLNAIVIPTLERLRGARSFYPCAMGAYLKDPLKLKEGRVHMILGRYDNGVFVPFKNGKQGSGAVNAISNSNAIALVGEQKSLLQGHIKILPYVMEFSDTMGAYINE
ncbi:hypothetical protein BKH46_08150 [Helicobacter sp. 12S02634-8]|uniref:molybdopterin molybdotransferase MoeA n=1 Tax=Helicobacter sp. 12S02634-8 TaxID=1476199 RepID=UPI000BA605A8|nr:molybdopterin molybdotransferase MoeA [Helicobacter sp. 12S02634-8]PAF46274.1 hypothetical protein BKH46_08150 [Helicobacter sp. 12S02634-8]